MLDELIRQVEQLRAEGAVVILKWDGERSHAGCTVVVTRNDTDYVWREDTNNIGVALSEALLDYRVHHAR